MKDKIKNLLIFILGGYIRESRKVELEKTMIEMLRISILILPPSILVISFQLLLKGQWWPFFLSMAIDSILWGVLYKYFKETERG